MRERAGRENGEEGELEDKRGLGGWREEILEGGWGEAYWGEVRWGSGRTAQDGKKRN